MVVAGVIAYSPGPGGPDWGWGRWFARFRRRALVRRWQVVVDGLVQVLRDHQSALAGLALLLGAGVPAAAWIWAAIPAPPTDTAGGEFATIRKCCSFPDGSDFLSIAVAVALVFWAYRREEKRYTAARLARSLWRVLQVLKPSDAITLVRRHMEPRVAVDLTRALDRYADDAPLGPALASCGLWPNAVATHLKAARRDTDVFGPLRMAADQTRELVSRQLKVGALAVLTGGGLMLVLTVVRPR
jgi:hypothetical protein